MILKMKKIESPSLDKFANFLPLKQELSLIQKKLYEASGYAVKELLKIATMMNKAMKSSENIMEEDESSNNALMDFN